MLFLNSKRVSSLYARRNDGTTPSPFAAGNKVDDLFSFVRLDAGREAGLFVDEVVLYDAGRGVELGSLARKHR